VTLAELTEVWSPLSALIALVSGVAFGLAVGWFATNPAYSRSDLAGPLRIALGTVLFSVSAGLVFYAGQTLGSFLSDDPHWSRVMSRYGQWILFSLAIGVTTWALIRRDRSRRRRRAHQRALAEIATPPYRGEGDH
jgi:hypothetical protein